MKTTTIISKTLILMGILALHSCRENEMNPLAETNSAKEEKQQQKMDRKTEKDSIKSNNIIQPDNTEDTIGDPPPKDRGQWKIVP